MLPSDDDKEIPGGKNFPSQNEIIQSLRELQKACQNAKKDDRLNEEAMDSLIRTAYDLLPQTKRAASSLTGRNRIKARHILCSFFFSAVSWHFQKTSFCLRDGFAKQALEHMKQGISLLNDAYRFHLIPRRSPSLQRRFYLLRKEARYWEKKFHIHLLTPARLSKTRLRLVSLLPSLLLFACFWFFTNAAPALLLAFVSYLAFYRTLRRYEFYRA